jgi:hypothetical protein
MRRDLDLSKLRASEIARRRTEEDLCERRRRRQIQSAMREQLERKESP